MYDLVITLFSGHNQEKEVQVDLNVSILSRSVGVMLSFMNIWKNRMNEIHTKTFWFVASEQQVNRIETKQWPCYIGWSENMSSIYSSTSTHLRFLYWIHRLHCESLTNVGMLLDIVRCGSVQDHAGSDEWRCHGNASRHQQSFQGKMGTSIPKAATH